MEARCKRYIRLKGLGEGGFGVVSKCLEANTGVVVAVKSMPLWDAVGRSNWQPACKEATILSELSGEANVVDFHDFFEDEAGLHIAMEFCPGGDLNDELERSGLYTHVQAGAILAQLAQGLHSIHRKGYLHRDLKLDNVLVKEVCPVTGVPMVKISDFGLALPMNKDRGKIHTGRFAGTPAYSAIECFAGDFDASTDVWALGVIAYLLVCGSFPHKCHAKTREQMKRNIERRRPLFLEREWLAVPHEVKCFISSMLMPKGSFRPTVEQILRHPWIQSSSDYMSAAALWDQSRVPAMPAADLGEPFLGEFPQSEQVPQVPTPAGTLAILPPPNMKSIRMQGVYVMIPGNEGDQDQIRLADEENKNSRRMSGIFQLGFDENGEEVLQRISVSGPIACAQQQECKEMDANEWSVVRRGFMTQLQTQQDFGCEMPLKGIPFVGPRSYTSESSAAISTRMRNTGTFGGDVSSSSSSSSSSSTTGNCSHTSQAWSHHDLYSKELESSFS